VSKLIRETARAVLQKEMGNSQVEQ